VAEPVGDPSAVPVADPRGGHLVAGPLRAHRAAISSPESYAASQALGRDLRDAGVELFLYASARDAEAGLNVGAFTPVV